MKNVRYVVLLSLVVLLLASCVGLPPVFPSRAPSPQGEEEPVGAVADITVEVPAAAEQPAVDQPTPLVSDSSVVTATVEVVVTEVVTPAVPLETPATPTAEQVMGANPVVEVVWEWAALLKTQPAVQSVVPDPASYTIIFAEDGNVSIKADCNNASGTYTLVNDQMVITMGQVTRAACPPGSLSDLMLTSLSKVGSYLIDGGDLVLRLGDTGDSILFRNAGPAAVPAAPPAVEAPAAAAPPQSSGAPAETTAQAATLAGPVWQWERFVDMATGRDTIEVRNPENYTVTFMNDGSVAMKADCNQAAGTYTVSGAQLVVGVGPMTLAACAADSLGEEFLISLTSAANYSIQDGKLTIDLIADAGRMEFGSK